MNNDYVRSSRNYETLICSAFNCNKGAKNGACEQFMEKLFFLEFEDKHSIIYQRHFIRVKRNIEKSLCKLKKRKRYLDSQNTFMPLLVTLNSAKTANDLAIVINKSLIEIDFCENRLQENS